MIQKSYTQKKDDIAPIWFVADASEQVLGRLSSQIAHVLRGKHKATYTPHMDGGDYVVVTNADKIRLTGNKLEAKKYYSYSGFRGGLKEKTAKVMMEEEPTEVIKAAIRGMLPKGPLGRQMLSKLKVYVGSEHPHHAQNPQSFEFSYPSNP